MAGERAGLIPSFPSRSGGTLPALWVVMGRGGLRATSGLRCTREPSGEKGPGGDMSSECNGASLASGPPGHLTLSLALGGSRSLCCPAGARGPLRAFQKRASHRHPGPEEVLGQQEPPVAAGSALPASGVRLGGQSLSFKSSVRLSPRKAPRGTE